VVTYSDQIGMQVNRHYPVRLGPLGVEPVELAAAHLFEPSIVPFRYWKCGALLIS